MANTPPTVEEVYTFEYIYRILVVPAFFGCLAGLMTVFVKPGECTPRRIFGNALMCMLFSCLIFLVLYEWSAVSPHYKLAFSLAIGLTSTFWDKALLEILFKVGHKVGLFSAQDVKELRKLKKKQEQEDDEYISPKRIPREFLDDDEGSVSIDFDKENDRAFCDYPKVKKPAKPRTSKKAKTTPSKEKPTEPTQKKKKTPVKRSRKNGDA